MPYWMSKMRQVGKQEEISSDRCIDDWVVIHWASQTDQWGNPLCNQDVNAVTQPKN